jgi:hypothetical protein
MSFCFAHRSEEVVDPEGIANTKGKGRRIAIKTKPDVEVDLMIVIDAVTGARVEQLAAAAAYRKGPDIFDETKSRSATSFSITKVD